MGGGPGANAALKPTAIGTTSGTIGSLIDGTISPASAVVVILCGEGDCGGDEHIEYGDNGDCDAAAAAAVATWSCCSCCGWFCDSCDDDGGDDNNEGGGDVRVCSVVELFGSGDGGVGVGGDDGGIVVYIGSFQYRIQYLN